MENSIVYESMCYSLILYVLRTLLSSTVFWLYLYDHIVCFYSCKETIQNLLEQRCLCYFSYILCHQTKCLVILWVLHASSMFVEIHIEPIYPPIVEMDRTWHVRKL